MTARMDRITSDELPPRMTLDQIRAERGLARLAYKGLGGWGWRENLAKAYGAAHGFTCAGGGWIYCETAGGGRAVCQGWGSFYQKFYARIWRQVIYADRFDGPPVLVPPIEAGR